MYSVMLVGSNAFCNAMRKISAFEQSGENILFRETETCENAVVKLLGEHSDLVIYDLESTNDSKMNFLHTCGKEVLCQCVIVIDSELNFEKARQAVLLNAFDYLLKPYDDSMLSDSISRALKYIDKTKNSDNISFIKKSIADSVCSGNTEKLENGLASIYDKIIAGHKRDTNETGAMLLDIAEYVFEKCTDKFCWIKDFVTDFDLFKNSMTNSTSMKDQMYRFERFVREITAAVKLLYIIAESKSLIVNAVNYILQHSDKKITQQQVADVCFVNKSYLSHIFKCETGISFVDYISLVKITRAKKIIKESDIMIFEIAEKLGFDDADYFCRKFKTITGMTPKTYREKQRFIDGANAYV